MLGAACALLMRLAGAQALGEAAPPAAGQPASADPARAQADAATPDPGKPDMAWALRTIPQLPHGNEASPLAPSLPLTQLAADSITDEVELRAHEGGWSLIWTGFDVQQQHAAPAASGVVDELVLDRQWAGAQWALGKKVMSWDVGFGFRPLDVVQQENRRALLVYALEGIPGVSAEVYGADWAWTFVLANPGSEEAALPRNDGSAAVRYFRRVGAADVYAVGRISRRDEAQAGSSFSWVVNDNFEWHASGLYQRRYELELDELALAGTGGPALSEADPMRVFARHNAPLGLVGATWTSEAGWSVLGEAWYDGTAYRASDWAALQTLDARQLALQSAGAAPAAAVAANLAYSTDYYLPVNLLRGNLLLHASWKIDSFTPVLDVLETPGDGGIVVTASAQHEGNRWRLDTGVRAFTGRADSAYRRLPVSRIFYLGLSFFP
jgi:hypothetical protein